MMQPRLRTNGLLAVLLLLSVGAGPAVSQAPTGSRQPPRFRGGANLVRVDVFATKDGVPVQNLTADDFELLEDGKPQKIDSFEHVVVTPAGATDERIEPNTVEASRQLIEDPHRRVFVIYLDDGNVPVGGSHDIRQPLIGLLTRLLGPDDVVGVMTPGMNPNQISFARKTEVTEGGLSDHWFWGRKDSLQLDEREQMYDQCYPKRGDEKSALSAVAEEMIARKRERTVLDSLDELVKYLGGAREGRTAVITITPGWVLYGPNESLTQAVNGVPGTPPIGGVGPNAGLTTATKNNSAEGLQYQCDRDRMELAMMDDGRQFRDILGEANRADVSFYPVDPRGLVVFDSAIGPYHLPTLTEDRAMLSARAGALRTLAENTDGIAILQTRDLDAGLKRVSDDLTSYYLLGYYSTNTKLDGKFRKISVRAKRAGIDIRARRGYRAATEEEVTAARKAAAAPVPDATKEINRALGTLDAEARSGRAVRTSGDPLVFHRGFSTRNQYERATERVFPRSERLRFELAAEGDVTWTGKLLDRNGTALPVPITVGDRVDASTGQRWLSADLTLAPLGAGDYVVALTTSEPNENAVRLIAIRVTTQ